MPPPTSWSPPRARIQLKLAIQRTRVLTLKKTQLAKTTRREIANLLDRNKVESARIKVEGIMSEDLMIELLELLELMCEVLLARFGLLENVKDIDPGVSEAVASIIHAAPRTELKELHMLREMLMSKAGRDYSINAIENNGAIVPERITSKLRIDTPSKDLVDLYLYEIAKAYSVDWRPEGFPDPNAPVSPAPIEQQSTTTQPPTLAPFDSTALQSLPHQPPPIDPQNANETVVVRTNLPPPTSSSEPKTTTTTTNDGNTTGVGQAKKDQDDFEALSRRFAELKKR